MAERKNKTTTEEVVVEKHFCKNCGKELIGDEVCDCTTSNEKTITINTSKIKDLGLSFLNIIKNMFIKPASTIDEETSKSDMKMSIILLVIISLTMGLYMMGGFKSIMTSIGVLGGFNLNDAISLPYFKIFIYVALISFIVSFIPITVAFLTTKLFKGENLNYKQCISLYATSMAPTIASNLLMALLYAINILSGLGAIIGAIVSVACFFNFILGFIKITKIKENKKAYALTTLTVVELVVSLIVSLLLMGSLLGDIYRDVKVNDNPFNDLFDYTWS